MPLLSKGGPPDTASVAAALVLALLAPIAAAQTPPQLTTLYSFSGQSGEYPNGVIFGKNGELFGTTEGGGYYYAGTVFELTGRTHALLYTFTGGPDGSLPNPGLILGPDGTLYGTTFRGGTINDTCPSGCGTLFGLQPPASPEGGLWTFSILHSFSGQNGDGSYPNGGLILGSNGKLYGTAAGAGASIGSVFELAPPVEPGGPWQESTVYNFTGASVHGDGQEPNSLIFGGAGVIYGTTYVGGITTTDFPAGFGTVFELRPPEPAAGGGWTESVLYRFKGPRGDAALPVGLVLGAHGGIYGAAAGGGAAPDSLLGNGAIFELVPPVAPGGVWTETMIHGFSQPNRGVTPQAGLAMGNNGVIYGATAYGGTKPGGGDGILFGLVPPASPGGAWTETLLHVFHGFDGANPGAGRVIGRGSAIYGTTSEGGASAACEFGCGTIFELALQ